MLFRQGARTERIFQLSLTEIAFTLAFILMLLLGYSIFKEQTEKQAIEDKISSIEAAPEVTAALNDARGKLAEALRGANASSPDEVISRLVEDLAARRERDVLKAKIEDLNAQISAMVEVRKLLDSQGAGPDNPAQATVASALALRQEAKDELAIHSGDKPGTPAPSPSGAHAAKTPTTKSMEVRPDMTEGDLRALVKDAIRTRLALDRLVRAELKRPEQSKDGAELVASLVDSTRRLEEISKREGSPEAVRKENTDLRGQIVFLKRRLEARGGRDFPPCWADETTGRVQPLFSIEVRPEGVAVSPAWPPVREADARVLPGIAQLLEGTAHAYPDFGQRVQGIFKLSQAQECRHYVVLRSAIQDGIQSDRRRLEVEGYFYKIEVRR